MTGLTATELEFLQNMQLAIIACVLAYPFTISLIGVADNLQSKHLETQRPACNVAVKNNRHGELYRNINNASIYICSASISVFDINY